MPLPPVSSSTIPAYKQAGYGVSKGRAGSFWVSESTEYWRTRRRNRLMAKGKMVVMAFIVVAATLSLVKTTFGKKQYSTEARHQTADEKSTKAQKDSESVLLRKQVCRGHGKKVELDSSTCAKACAKARTAAPKPLAHRSCLAGCRGGINAGWESGCSGGRRQDCAKAASAQCDMHCGSYRNQFPKPTIFNTCQRACLDVMDDACFQSKETLLDAEKSGIVVDGVEL